jgi:hypothetical protein
MTTADLARAEFMTPQSMGASVAELEEHGLVARTDDPPMAGGSSSPSLAREVARWPRPAPDAGPWLAGPSRPSWTSPSSAALLAALELLRRFTGSATHRP